MRVSDDRKVVIDTLLTLKEIIMGTIGTLLLIVGGVLLGIVVLKKLGVM